MVRWVLRSVWNRSGGDNSGNVSQGDVHQELRVLSVC